jgi:thiol-disulfide isomerase/thioredoxin
MPMEGHLPPLEGANAWLNSPPLTPDGLRGQVVLVNFWTYTCINWLRTLPYVREWAEKYREQGLVVLGVHTPEFEFEHDLHNVRQAMKAMKVEYPVAIDNDYALWQAFDNHYWPALYLADAQGRIRHHWHGEGGYGETERIIQELLKEAGARDVGDGLVKVRPEGAEVPADWRNLGSPETYLGYLRGSNFAAKRGAEFGTPHRYTVPEGLELNHWALARDWTVNEGAVALNEAGGRLAFRFRARDLNLVMGPVERGAKVQFWARLDGQPPVDAAGADLEADGHGTVGDQRLYQLVRQPQPVVERLFEIEFESPGVQALAFTFG